MNLDYYHNPACSKSRATWEWLQQNGVAVRVVDYLNDVPSESEIVALAGKLGCRVHDMVRTGEAEYARFARLDADDDAAWAAAIHACPVLLQRPILANDNAAAICRPPQSAADWLVAQGYERG